MAPLRDGPPTADEGIGDLLRSLPRREPPPVTLEAILGRWQRRRRSVFLGGALALAASVLAFVLVPSPPNEIPVHLQIRVIEASPDAESSRAQDDSRVAFPVASAPEELQAP